MTWEQAVMFQFCFWALAVAAVVWLLIWFIVTLSRIQSNTRRTADAVARLIELAERTAPPEKPVDPTAK